MLRFSKHPLIEAKPKACDDPKKKKSWNRSETDFHVYMLPFWFYLSYFPSFPICLLFSFLGMLPPQKAAFHLPHLCLRVSRRLHGRVWCTKSYGLRLHFVRHSRSLDFRRFWLQYLFSPSQHKQHRMLILILRLTCLVLENSFLAKSQFGPTLVMLWHFQSKGTC